MKIKIQENILLKKFSRMRVAGRARYFFRAKTISDVIQALEIKALDKKYKTTPLLILGKATNILFNDDALNYFTLKIDIHIIRREHSSLLFVGAGTLVGDLVSFALKNKIRGFEWASGLPGTIGGAIRGNAGAFGGEIARHIHSVVVVNDEKRISVVSLRQCAFGYRDSIFKSNSSYKNAPIVGAYMRIDTTNDVRALRVRAKEILHYRATRHPIEFPTLGSTFKNISCDSVPRLVLKQFSSKIKHDPFPVIPVALLLDEAKIKGVSCGGAMFSKKHPNFIINTGGAKFSDIRRLIMIAQNKILKKFSVTLEPEIEIIF